MNNYKIMKFIRKWVTKNLTNWIRIKKSNGCITREFDFYGNYVLKYDRSIRGDLVELYHNGKIIFSYVDQFYQYSGLMGFNDCINNINIKLKEIKKIFLMHDMVDMPVTIERLYLKSTK